MRIGVDARPLSYERTGIGYYLKCLLDELQHRDLQNTYFLISNAPIRYCIENKKWKKIEGNLKRKLLSTLWMQTIGALNCIRNKIDLFWSPRHHLPLLLPTSIKTVLTVHDLVHHHYPETMALPNLTAERILLRKSLHRSSAIITDSAATANDIRAVYRIKTDNIFTIQPGIPSFPVGEDPDPGSGSDSPVPGKYFLFVGTLDPRKNFFRILKAFESIQDKCPDTYLLLVGGMGWRNKDFFTRLKEHPLKSRIQLTGYVGRKELGRLYRKALCLLFPSMYEGFGFPILEAMSLGTPVITSASSSMPEVAGNAAVLVNPQDVEAMAESMIRVATQPDFRTRLVQKGYRQIKKFSWQKSAIETLRVFESVMV